MCVCVRACVERATYRYVNVVIVIILNLVVIHEPLLTPPTPNQCACVRACIRARECVLMRAQTHQTTRATLASQTHGALHYTSAIH